MTLELHAVVPCKRQTACIAEGMFLFFSNRLGCLGSVGVSIVLSLVLIGVLRSCS